MATHWLVLSFITTHEATDLLSELLQALGADGVDVRDAQEFRQMVQDPAHLSFFDLELEEQTDTGAAVQAYFKYANRQVLCIKEPDLLAERGLYWQDNARQWCSLTELIEIVGLHLERFREFLDIGPGYRGHHLAKESDWADQWKKHYRPFNLTSRLMVRPSWLELQEKGDHLVITLDPGSAFGSGTHESTKLAASFLEDVIAAGDTVLDLGSGSGILSIAAALLGASMVEAIDIDPEAVRVTIENCALNNVAVTAHPGTLAAARFKPYNLVVANITADILTDSMPDLAELLLPGGYLILAGIIKDKEAGVVTAAERFGLTLKERREQRDWCALLVKR